jgi:flagellar hook-associated protein 3 FlgL
VRARLEERLGELDRTTESIGSGLGVLGSRGSRLRGTLQRLADDELFVQSRLSNVRDTDLSEAAIDLARSDLLLQTAQAAGVRLLQTTLLNFLG